MGDHDLVPPLVGNETSATEKGHGRLKDQGYYVIPVDRKTLRFGQGSFIPRQNLSATKDPAGFLPPEAFANRLIHQDDFVKHIDLDIDGSDDDPNSTSPELKKVNTESKKDGGAESNEGSSAPYCGSNSDIGTGTTSTDHESKKADELADSEIPVIDAQIGASTEAKKDEEHEDEHDDDDSGDGSEIPMGEKPASSTTCPPAEQYIHDGCGYFMYDKYAEPTLLSSHVWIAVPLPDPPKLKRRLTPTPPSCPPPPHLLRNRSPETSSKKPKQTPDDVHEDGAHVKTPGPLQ